MCDFTSQFELLQMCDFISDHFVCAISVPAGMCNFGTRKHTNHENDEPKWRNKILSRLKSRKIYCPCHVKSLFYPPTKVTQIKYVWTEVTHLNASWWCHTLQFGYMLLYFSSRFFRCMALVPRRSRCVTLVQGILDLRLWCFFQFEVLQMSDFSSNHFLSDLSFGDLIGVTLSVTLVRDSTHITKMLNKKFCTPYIDRNYVTQRVYCQNSNSMSDFRSHTLNHPNKVTQN